MSELGPPIPSHAPPTLPDASAQARPPGPPVSPAATPTAGPPVSTQISAEARALLQAQSPPTSPLPAPAPAPPTAAPTAPATSPSTPLVPSPAPGGPSLASLSIPTLSADRVATVATAMQTTPQAARAWLATTAFVHLARAAVRASTAAPSAEVADEQRAAANQWADRAVSSLRRLLGLRALGDGAREVELERLGRRFIARSSEAVPLHLQLPELDALARALEAAAVARGAPLGELALLRALAEQPQSMGLFAPEGPLARGLLGFLVTALVIGLGWVLLR